MKEASKAAGEENTAPPGAHFDTRLPQLSAWRRMQIPLIAGAAYGLVRSIGPTLRFEILGWQHAERVHAGGRRMIWAFWHRCMFSVMWWARHRGIVVLNSTNFDGQWTRRLIERLGYGTAQGSSTRGGLSGLVVMARRLAQGLDVAFTIDGPRGPRYIAKPGPVMLARRTGCPIGAFHVGVESAYTLKKTWDLFQIPRPFSRAVIAFAPPIEVRPHTDRETVQRKHREMQASLERARHLTESWFRLSPGERDRHRHEWNR